MNPVYSAINMSKQYPSFTPPSAPIATPLVQLWLLRMLVRLGAHAKFILRGGFHCDRIAEAIGLGHMIDTDGEEFSPAIAKSTLRRLHLQAEANAIARPETLNVDQPLASNLQGLANLVGLSNDEQRILSFVVQLHNNRLLDDAADMIGPLTSLKAIQSLSDLLDIPLENVRKAFESQGTLSGSGLVSLDRRNACQLRGKLDLLSDTFSDGMISSEATALSLLKDMVRPCTPPDLSLADYTHIQLMVDVLKPFLEKAIQTSRKGVNIFIHGAPGTGKTQFVKCMAHALGVNLFEVASEDEDGDPVGGPYRLRAYRAAQSFFSTARACILFDEVEDVFAAHDHNSRSSAQSHKAWINRCLEENAVPAFWISNSIDCLDPAFVRRFDLIFDIPVPPRSQRLRILDKHCTATIGHTIRNRISENTQLAPAVVAKASSVIRTVESSLQPAQLEAAFELILANTLKAQGYKPVNKDPSIGATVRYDPSCTNADADLADLATQLKQTQSGRICLYGPPGTGKTAYGHWLAEQLEKPLMVKKASDLISKYLGETEKNLANAFRDAEKDNAVLLIDEVDSFLQNRESATRSWEVSQVNELLTQLEAFNGVFIASTNLMGQLDAASLRRFDLKIRFDYLRPAQANDLFERYCTQLNLNDDGSNSLELAGQHKLKQLNTLTPGDFAAVARQSRLRPLRTQQALVNALAQECALKPGARQTPIGFLVA